MGTAGTTGTGSRVADAISRASCREVLGGCWLHRVLDGSNIGVASLPDSCIRGFDSLLMHWSLIEFSKIPGRSDRSRRLLACRVGVRSSPQHLVTWMVQVSWKVEFCNCRPIIRYSWNHRLEREELTLTNFCATFLWLQLLSEMCAIVKAWLECMPKSWTMLHLKFWSVAWAACLQMLPSQFVDCGILLIVQKFISLSPGLIMRWLGTVQCIPAKFRLRECQEFYNLQSQEKDVHSPLVVQHTQPLVRIIHSQVGNT
jgi:hypothetical protein